MRSTAAEAGPRGPKRYAHAGRLLAAASALLLAIASPRAAVPAAGPQAAPPAATKAYGAHVGIYAAEVLGSNPYLHLHWDLYPEDKGYFFQLGAGVGTVQSRFSKSLFRAAVYENNFLGAFEGLIGYTYFGPGKGARRYAGGHRPYFVGGVVGLYQGSVPNVGLVLGFGNRMHLPFFGKRRNLSLTYALHDQIYSQKIGSRPALTNNLVLRAGVQVYR